MAQIEVDEAHTVTTGDPSVLVGVLDSGIDATHPDLATQVAKDRSASCIGGVPDTSQAAWSPTTSSHRTHVAGTIAAAVNGVVEVTAPGRDTRWRDPAVSTITDAVLSTVPGGWGWCQGTSMASPHAAGAAALALSAHPALTPGGLASVLERTADPLPCPEGVHDRRPTLPQYQAVCTGGERNGFHGAENVNAFSAVQ